MNERLAFPTHRILTPVATVLMVIAFAATLALGFGLRAWTEHTSAAPPTGAAITQVHSAPPTLTRMGKPW